MSLDSSLSKATWPHSRAPLCWLGLSPAGHRSWPGQVGVSGWQSFRSTIEPRYPCGHKCSPPVPPPPAAARWSPTSTTPAGPLWAPDRPSPPFLPWRPPCFGRGTGSFETWSPVGLHWGPRQVTSRPGRGGGGDSARQRARLACLPTPSWRGSCGRRQPIGWAWPEPAGRA